MIYFLQHVHTASVNWLLFGQAHVVGSRMAQMAIDLRRQPWHSERLVGSDGSRNVGIGKKPRVLMFFFIFFPNSIRYQRILGYFFLEHHFLFPEEFCDTTEWKKVRHFEMPGTFEEVFA